MQLREPRPTYTKVRRPLYISRPGNDSNFLRGPCGFAAASPRLALEGAALWRPCRPGNDQSTVKECKVSKARSVTAAGRPRGRQGRPRGSRPGSHRVPIAGPASVRIRIISAHPTPAGCWPASTVDRKAIWKSPVAGMPVTSALHACRQNATSKVSKTSGIAAR